MRKDAATKLGEWLGWLIANLLEGATFAVGFAGVLVVLKFIHVL